MAIENTLRNLKLLDERKMFTLSSIKRSILKIRETKRGCQVPKTQVRRGLINIANTRMYQGEVLHNLDKKRKISKHNVLSTQRI